MLLYCLAAVMLPCICQDAYYCRFALQSIPRLSHCHKVLLILELGSSSMVIKGCCSHTAMPLSCYLYTPAVILLYHVTLVRHGDVALSRMLLLCHYHTALPWSFMVLCNSCCSVTILLPHYSCCMPVSCCTAAIMLLATFIRLPCCHTMLSLLCSLVGLC